MSLSHAHPGISCIDGLRVPYIHTPHGLTTLIGNMTHLAGGSPIPALSDLLPDEMTARMHQSIQHHVSGSATVWKRVFPFSGIPAKSGFRKGWLNLRCCLWTDNHGAGLQG